MVSKAFLDQFEDDIFISYAHLDDLPLTEGQKGWVTAFHQTLEVLLRQRLGANVRVWRDPKLTGNDIFADKLINHLPKVATLVAVLSPGYLNSEWCKRELDEFVRQTMESGGISVGEKARVFKVQRTQVEFADCPPALQALLGYQFFEVDPKTGRPREFAADRNVQQFLDKLNDLAFDIRDLFRLLRDQSSPQLPPGKEAKIVYLAEASSDQAGARDRVRRELLTRGYIVLPDRPLPLQSAELREAVGGYLDRAHLSVHLLGGKYGVVPEDETSSLSVLQLEYAGTRSDRLPFARIVWTPPDLAETEERQRLFLEDVQDHEARRAGTDILSCSIEDLKTVIEDKLAELEKPAPAPQRVAATLENADPVRIYVIVDACDLDAVQPLVDEFFAQGCEVILPVCDGDEIQVREDHKENLQMCDAVLIYQAESSELWLRAKLRDLQKANGFGRTKPLTARAVLLAGQETPAKQRFRTLEAMVIKQFGTFEPSPLTPFLASATTRLPLHG